MTRELVRERHFRGVLGVGYILRTEHMTGEDAGFGPGFDITSAVTRDGHYIGTSKWAYRLAKRGIIPKLADPTRRVCSIGFCVADLSWYGWSHRAISGFSIGSVAKEGDSCTTSGFIDEYRDAHPELDERVPVGFEAHTLEDAKRMAIAFAESVR